MTLSLGALRGALWNTVETVGSQLTSFVLFLVFARLISADGVGLVQLAVTLIGFVTIFVEHGFSATIIRAPSVSAPMLDTAFWLGVAGATCLALGLSFFAPAIARAYATPELCAVLRALAWTVPLITLGSVQTALLTRELSFKQQALRRLVAVLIGGTVGVVLALRGAGPWSLVARLWIETLIDCIAAWLLTDFRPGRRIAAAEARLFARFGSGVVGSYAIGFLNRRTEEILIGFFLGPLALGYFAVASRAVQLVTEVALRAAQRTSLPLFAKLQHEPARALEAYYRAVELAASVACPIFVGLSAVAAETCLLFFGSKWQPAIPAMRILGFAGIPMAVTIYVAPVLIAVGRPQWLLGYTVLETVLNVAAAATALPFGLEGVCVAHVTRSLLILPLVLHMMHRAVGASPFAVLQRLAAPAASALIMYASLELLRSALAALPTAVLLPLLALAGGLVYTICMLAIGRGAVADARRMLQSYLRAGLPTAR